MKLHHVPTTTAITKMPPTRGHDLKPIFSIS